MERLRLISAVTIILWAVTMLCLVTMMPAQQTAPETSVVTITPHPTGPPAVNPDSVDVYKSKNQQAESTCSGGCDFTVIFPSSHAKPFSDSTFNQAQPKSGIPTGPPGAYPYKVEVDQAATDPQIIIH